MLQPKHLQVWLQELQLSTQPGTLTSTHPQCAALWYAVLVVLQVLSNPELRAKYDKYGSAALDVEFADPSMIFGMLFGSELFEPIVGEFLIAAATSKGRELTEKEINHMQVSWHCACCRTGCSTLALVIARQGRES